MPPSGPSRLILQGDWETLSSPPPLTSGQVHLWRVVVPDADRIPAHWPGVLNDEEQARAARKRIPVDARRTLASRACLRLLLGRYLAVPPASVVFAANATGKPHLASPVGAPPRLEFNVSHSGDWVVFAFAHALPLGIDVERHRELEFSALVNSCFSPQERESWTKLPASDHARAFFSAWTRKEACLKGLGLGLHQSLDSFSVAIDSVATAELVWCAGDVTGAQPWLVVPVDLAPGYSCALAVAPTATSIHTFTLDATGPHSG